MEEIFDGIYERRKEKEKERPTQIGPKKSPTCVNNNKFTDSTKKEISETSVSDVTKETFNDRSHNDIMKLLTDDDVHDNISPNNINELLALFDSMSKGEMGIPKTSFSDGSKDSFCHDTSLDIDLKEIDGLVLKVEELLQEVDSDKKSSSNSFEQKIASVFEDFLGDYPKDESSLQDMLDSCGDALSKYKDLFDIAGNDH